MSDRLDLGASYCPICGHPVEAAEAIATTDEPIIGQGIYERAGAHLAVEGCEIRIYQHEGAADGD